MDTPVSSLSGGNQQKVVVARELSRPLKVLIASQPTRGVDVGSIEFIHKRIITERDNGTAVIIVSTELDEIFALSDRIAVMYDGRIVGPCLPDIAREDIGLMMAGAARTCTYRGGHRCADPRQARGTPASRKGREAPPGGPGGPRSAPSWLPTVKVTLAAFVLALLVGAVLIVFSDRRASRRSAYFFAYPWDFFKFAGRRR